VEVDAALARVEDRVDLLVDVRQGLSLDNALMTDGKRPRRVIPPPVYALACIVAGALLERFRPMPLGVSRFEAHFAGGLLLFLAGGLLAAWAVLVMTRHRTTVEPGRVPTSLVRSGPFRFSRNPIYLAFVVMCASIGVIIDSAWLLVVAALLLIVLDRLVIAREEVVIGGEFGEEYAAYRRQVRRWL
jgi:protein-S-isoprenylcysteine O-methyltransferase Ste14